MAGLVKFRFDRSSLREIRDMLGDVDRNLNDCTEVFWDIIHDVLVPSEAKTFDAEGPGWKPLSEAYALQKARKIGHTQILVWSEDLKDSVASEGGNQYSIREAGKRRLLFGTTRPWASVHQNTRPFLVVTDEAYDAMISMAVDWFLHVGRYED